ncbi:MAG: ImmA/IrrE family metallo-endopeptidase [Nanoarchaeota archaeon]|nr:ImmA/IrrE family metallo-endopeptidase [Nanoarchaeota archaeon]
MAKTKTFKVKVEPKVLKWALSSSGWEEEELILKLKISKKTYFGWLDGLVEPTIKQLENISNKIKRPLASLLLSEAPIEPPKPKDYRMLPDKVDKFDKKTVLAIRKARRLQKLSKELALNINDETKPKVEKVTLLDNPNKLGIKYRELFELTEEKQKKFKNPYELFNYLREKLEDNHIFSLKISMPIEDARGFALADDTPAILVVNSADLITARIFTLLHEFAHLLLGDTAISIPEFTTTDKRERWCNQFAASFLLPEEIAKKIFTETKLTLTESKTLRTLSNRYKVSKAMLLHDMVTLGYISNNKFKEIIERPRIEKKESEKKGGVGIPSENRCISEMGTKFVSLVADNLDKGYITYGDALNYLSVKSNKLKAVFRKATK